MLSPPAYHIGYYGNSRWTQNFASAAWALYTPSHEILHSSGICLGPATNNQAEYTMIIGLLADAQRHHICHLSVFLDSQLVVLHLNNVYRVRDPCLFRKYLQDDQTTNLILAERRSDASSSLNLQISSEKCSSSHYCSRYK
jgi:ribonuclease HI